MAANLLERHATSIEYRKMKLGVANCLTVNNAINLATIFNFSPAAIDQLESSKAPGLMFMRVLEQYKILTETKVDELEDALRNINQDMAVKFVDQYKREGLGGGQLERRGSESSLASEDSGIAAAGGVGQQMLSLSLHEDAELGSLQTVEAFCNRCNRTVSWRDAAAGEHSSHREEIIPGEDLEQEVSRRRSRLSSELEAMTSQLRQSQDAAGSTSDDGQTSQMMEEVSKLAEDFAQKVELRKRELLDELAQTQRDRDVDLEAYKLSVQEMADLCKILKEELSSSTGDGGGRDADRGGDRAVTLVGHLVHLNELREQLDAKREGVTATLKSLQENRCRVFLRPTSNDGHFAELFESTLAGMVWVLEDQLVMVFDERRTTGRVEVKSFEGPEVTNETWTKAIEVGHLDGEVVVSGIEYYRGPHPHILLAVGRTAYMLQLSYDGRRFDGVCETKSYELKGLPTGARVTAICGHEQGSRHRDKFVVANSASTDVYQYNGACELDRELQCSQFASSVRNIACVDDTIAVVDNVNGNVALLATDATGVTSLVLTLTPPDIDAAGAMIPWVVVWTGALWLVLWVPDKGQKELKWCVTSHNEDGSKVQLYEGTYGRIHFPVTITRYIFGVMIGFSDSSVHKFEQV